MEVHPAVRLTDEEAAERVSAAFRLDQIARGAIREHWETGWVVAKALYEFDEAKAWQWLGDYDTLSDWLADPEVGMSRSTYYRYVRVHREVIVIRGFVPAPGQSMPQPDKVDLVLGAVQKGDVKLEDALDDAATNGYRDLRQRYLGEDEPAPEGAPSIEGGDGREEGAPPPAVDDDYELPEMVPTGVAVQLLVVLEQVLHDCGTRVRRPMSDDLRGLVVDTIEFAHGQGVHGA